MAANPATRRRLGCLTRHMERLLPGAQLGTAGPAAASTPDARAEEHGGAARAAATLDSVQQQHLREFVSRGVTIVGPEEHGLPAEIHRQVWENLKAGNGGDGIGTRMPEMVTVLNSPGMVRALNAIMGEDWAIVPFIHSGFGGAGPNDQTWYALRCTPAPVLPQQLGMSG
jgi:hypothetical protein